MSLVKYKINLSRPSHLPAKSIDSMEHIRYIVSYLCLGIICVLAAYIISSVITFRNQKEQELYLLGRLEDYNSESPGNSPFYSYPLFKNMYNARTRRKNFSLKVSGLFSRFEKPLDLNSVIFRNDSLVLEGKLIGYAGNIKEALDKCTESLVTWPQFSQSFSAPVALTADVKSLTSGDVSGRFKLIAVEK